jgi:hypothetical protein
MFGPPEITGGGCNASAWTVTKPVVLVLDSSPLYVSAPPGSPCWEAKQFQRFFISAWQSG